MKLSLTSRRMITVICLSALVMVAAGIVVSLTVSSIDSMQALYFPLGVILSSALNILKVILLERAINKTLDMEDPKAGSNYIRIQYLLRYLLSGVVLVVAGLITRYVDPPFINIVGALVGIFTMQISVIIVRSMKIEETS